MGAATRGILPGLRAKWLAALVAGLCCLWPAEYELQAAPAYFLGLGNLAGSSGFSFAYDVSGDGKVVVGEASVSSTNSSGFRWTAASGMQPLDMPFAETTNADGSVIAGAGYRWTASGGSKFLQGIPAEVDPFTIQIGNISSSGTTLVGVYGSSPNLVAFRWDAPNGPATQLTELLTAVAVSADGSTILGTAKNSQAVLWHGAGSVTLIPAQPGEARAYPMAITPDGTTAAVNSATAQLKFTPFIWSAADGPTLIGSLNGAGGQTFVRDLTNDGRLAVGTGNIGSVTHAFVWTEPLGIFDLADWLVANGITGLAGWKLNHAEAVSADGRVFVGRGTNPSGNPEGWVVTLPPVGDASLDGHVDGADYVRWADHFLQTTKLFAEGDFNWDGVVNGADYVIWADHFAPAASGSTLQAVPEPSAIVLAFSGVVALLMRRRWRH